MCEGGCSVSRREGGKTGHSRQEWSWAASRLWASSIRTQPTEGRSIPYRPSLGPRHAGTHRDSSSCRSSAASTFQCGQWDFPGRTTQPRPRLAGATPRTRPQRFPDSVCPSYAHFVSSAPFGSQTTGDGSRARCSAAPGPVQSIQTMHLTPCQAWASIRPIGCNPVSRLGIPSLGKIGKRCKSQIRTRGFSPVRALLATELA